MSDFFEDEKVSIPKRDYERMVQYLNEFADIVETQKLEIEELKIKSKAEEVDVSDALNKYKAILDINK